MGRVQLEATHGAGVRAVGFFSRDRADEAVAELEDLLRTLSPDGRPTLYTWEREGADRVLVARPLAERSSWVWEADRAELIGEIDGLPLSAIAAAGSWALRLDGRPLAGQPPTDPIGRTVGPTRAPEVVAAPVARAGRDLRLRIAFSDGVPLPPDAEVTATLDGVQLGNGAPEGLSWVWPLPERRPEGGVLIVRTDLVVADRPVAAEARVVEATDLRGARAIVGGTPRVQLAPGDVITGFTFEGRVPRVVPLMLGDAKLVVRDGGIEPYALPEMPLPARLAVRPEGQDGEAGALVVGPARFHGAWTLVRDGRGDAKPPRFGPDFLRIREVVPRWTGTSEGRVRVPYEEVAVEAPVLDADFAPLLLADAVPLAESPRLAATPDGPLVAWVPGYPVLPLDVDAERRVKGRGSALRELAIEAAARGLVVRLETPRGRGVVFTGDRAAPGVEVPATNGVFAISAGRYAALFRGLWLDLEVRPGEIRLLRPLPIDGRLGPDVGPFLPLRAWRGPDGVFLQDGERVSEAMPLVGEAAWNGLVWGSDPRKRDGVVFLGWRLDPAFAAPAWGPWPAHGFRAGPSPAEGDRLSAIRLFRC